jgi:hypothetical protein
MLLSSRSSPGADHPRSISSIALWASEGASEPIRWPRLPRNPRGGAQCPSAPENRQTSSPVSVTASPDDTVHSSTEVVVSDASAAQPNRRRRCRGRRVGSRCIGNGAVWRIAITRARGCPRSVFTGQLAAARYLSKQLHRAVGSTTDSRPRVHRNHTHAPIRVTPMHRKCQSLAMKVP